MNNGLISQIRSYLKNKELSGILISRSDSFLGEYFPPFKTRLKTVTGGFSGSAGLALITLDKIVLFVDSRYTEQAKNQTDFDVYEVPSQITPLAWIKENLSDQKIGFNPWTHSYMWYCQMQEALVEKNILLQSVPEEQFEVWFGTSSFEQTDVFDYSLEYAGKASEQKIDEVAAIVHQQGWDAFLICSPENVSWLKNKRAKTVGEYPVVFERGYITRQGEYLPFLADEKKLPVQSKIGLDFSKTPVAIYNELSENYILEAGDDPINGMKACKNQTEIQNIRNACLFESQVICRFLAWVEKNRTTIDELDCSLKLKELRAESPLYFADSFSTIAASGGHAALAHYMADEKTSVPIINNPLLLVDTGGHYLNGTTDMTRTIAIGEPTPLMKRRYTQVLKGHIALATSTIEQGESTALLDEKAHSFLRADNVDYYHGTSHGIGMMLAVHEMPPTVNPKDTQGIRSGMIFSNEPAYYSVEQAFGIRLENMLLAVPQEKNLLSFENLLFIPFDARLVDFSLLTVDELKWLETYHKQIREKIYPYLSLDDCSVLDSFLIPFEDRR